MPQKEKPIIYYANMGEETPEEEWQKYDDIARIFDERTLFKKVWDIFQCQIFPILSMTYISAVIGISLTRGFFLDDPTSYLLGFFLVLWIAIPPVIWIFLRSIYEYASYADLSFALAALTQAILGLVCFFLFPDMGWLWGMKSFFILSIPVHLVMYFFFLRSGLPHFIAWPLNISSIFFLGIGLFLI
jgi:hypothetical protein